MDEELKVMQEHLEEQAGQDPDQDGKQNRLRSWAVWVSVAGAVWVILQAFGLTEKWGLNHETAKTIFNAIGTILIGFGILNNPTDRLNF